MIGDDAVRSFATIDLNSTKPSVVAFSPDSLSIYILQDHKFLEFSILEKRESGIIGSTFNYLGVTHNQQHAIKRQEQIL